MDIYIPDIKLPKDEPGAFQVIVMYVGADGKLRAECEGTHAVIAVLPHGRLIDEKDIVPKDGYIIADGMACIPVKDIANAPTIIPTSEEG